MLNHLRQVQIGPEGGSVKLGVQFTLLGKLHGEHKRSLSSWFIHMSKLLLSDDYTLSVR